MTTSAAFDPNITFGGTWLKFAPGQTIMGAGEVNGGGFVMLNTPLGSKSAFSDHSHSLTASSASSSTTATATAFNATGGTCSANALEEATANTSGHNTVPFSTDSHASNCTCTNQNDNSTGLNRGLGVAWWQSHHCTSTGGRNNEFWFQHVRGTSGHASHSAAAVAPHRHGGNWLHYHQVMHQHSHAGHRHDITGFHNHPVLSTTNVGTTLMPSVVVAMWRRIE
jgi:hypothetical protein